MVENDTPGTSLIGVILHVERQALPLKISVLDSLEGNVKLESIKKFLLGKPSSENVAELPTCL